MSYATFLRSGPPWDSIVDFALHRSFCGKKLYPRQLTLLKLIYLETDSMTDYDLEVINGWAEGFKRHIDVMGVPPDIWDRVRYLQENGYSHFTQVQFIGGRRGSKGIGGGVIGCERLAYFYSLDDWQAHYGLDPGSDGEMTVVSTTQNNAAKRQFADIRRTVENCRYLRQHVISNRYTEFSVRTPADERRIAALKAAKVPIDHEIATLYVNASASASSSLRGGAVFATFYDEMAHMLMGSGSVKSGEEIYESLQPSLDQFGKDQLTYIPSSPYCLEPSMRVLTEDLRWVPVAMLRVGDKLIGFDENHGGTGNGRTWQPATVTETSVIRAPRYEMTMKSGKKVYCTGEHMWLSSWASQITRWDWRKTSEMKPGDRIKSLGVEPWKTDTSREGGYLAGFFDGEGYLSKTMDLGYTQLFGPIQEHVNQMLKERDFEMNTWVERQERLARVRLAGGITERMRFLGTIRPERLLASFPDKFYGGRIYGNRRTALADEIVASVRRIHDGPVVALGTSTNTLIAEGLLSHNTKIGKFYELYQQGIVTLDVYNEREGVFEKRTLTQEMLGVEAEEEFEASIAEPEWLVIQLPSWELYTDWERSHTLPIKKNSAHMGPPFRNPVQWPPSGDRPENTRMRRLERRNPDKFKVERRAQFASVIDAYLDEARVDAMFTPPGWRPDLVPQDNGLMMYRYRMHGDPSTTNANFGFAIAHLEDAPCDGCGWQRDPTAYPPEPAHRCEYHGHVWPHVILDKLHVWQPGDYPGHVLDYVAIGEQIDGFCQRFISTQTVSFDQWNSAGFLSSLKRKYAGRMRIVERTFTEKENRTRCELFKSAMNLGWVHAYRDNFFEEGDGCLLELELKFLQEKNGKVIKQEFGPVTTKDLADAVMVVTVDLLKDALDRWHTANRVAVGSTAVAPLKSGREQERQQAHGIITGDSSMRAVTNRARIEEMRKSRMRQGRVHAGTARSRGRPR